MLAAEQRLHQLGEARLVVDDQEPAHHALFDAGSGGSVTTTSVPLPGVELDLEAAAVLVDDAAADAEPEARAALLGREERLAEARHHVGGHARAAVDDADDGAAVVVLVDDDVDLAAGRRRLRRVAHEVDHDLRDLAAVDDAERAAASSRSVHARAP